MPLWGAAWNQSLHPRGQGGKFAYTTGGQRQTTGARMAEKQRLIVQANHDRAEAHQIELQIQALQAQLVTHSTHSHSTRKRSSKAKGTTAAKKTATRHKATHHTSKASQTRAQIQGRILVLRGQVARLLEQARALDAQAAKL